MLEIGHDISRGVELARLEAHLTRAWQDALRLQSSRFYAELSLATTQLMAWGAVVGTGVATFVVLLLTPQRATPDSPPVSAVGDVQVVSTSAAPVAENERVERPRFEHPRPVVVAPGVADIRSLERRVIRWMLVFWGTGILTLTGATLALLKL